MGNALKAISSALKNSPMSIPSRFSQVVTRYPNRIAVSTSKTLWTYLELDNHSRNLACEILNRLGTISEPVALLMEHDAPLIAGILGILRAGKIYLVLDPTELATALTAKLSDSRARLLLTDKTNASLAYSIAAGRLQVAEIDNKFTFLSKSTISIEIQSDIGAWLMYTSGSTGGPKGVWQNHRNVVHHTEVYSDLIRLTPDDRLSLLTSCSLAASATHLFAALLNGATLCPFHVRSQGVERLADWLHQQHISVYHSVPTIFRHLMRSIDDNCYLEDLRLIRLGGEPMLRNDVEVYRKHTSADCILMHALSSTETGLISTLMINRQSEFRSRRVSVGHPVCGVEVLLVDEAGQPVNLGSEGRIAIRSAHLAQGYWLQPERTAEAFRSDTNDPQVRLFVTGDLGRLEPDGNMEHLGRVDQHVKIRGRRIDLAEVETAMQATNMFEELAVSAQEDPSGDKRMVAFVIPKTGTDRTAKVYRRLLQQSLSDYMIPDEFIMMTSLPKTTGGKVNRLALPTSHNLLRILSHNRPMPRDRLEKAIAGIWKSVLGISQIGRCDDFFELGGTSLQSIEILARIEDIFNLALSPSILVEHSTIEKLAALVANHATISLPNILVTLRASTSRKRPLFLIHGGAGHVAVYGQLSRRLTNRSIYALQAVGLQAESLPLLSISAMAKRYLREVMVIDPTGPYMLAGTCMGGLIAFEMAQQLLRLNCPVGLVALINSEYTVLRGRRLLWTERTVVAPLRDIFRILRWSIIRAIGLGYGVNTLPAYRHFVDHMNTRARRSYRPAFYPGKITLLLSTYPQYQGKDPRLIMARYARETCTINIPGHRKKLLVPPDVDELARQIEVCMDISQGEDLL